MLYQTDFETDDERCPYKPGRSSSSERHAFTLLASVCSSWYYTLTGYPLSPTGLWVQHQMKKLIDGKWFVFNVWHVSDHFSYADETTNILVPAIILDL